MSLANISVILPTYNEALNIELMITEVRRYIGETDEIIIVDDNSPDGTSKIIENLKLTIPQIKLIVRKDESGLTSAIQRGIDESTGNIVIWMDCDLSQPPSKIPEAVKEINENGFDVAVASRYVTGGSDIRSEAKNALVTFQVFLSWFLRVFTCFVLRSNFRDWSSGYIAVKRETLLEITPLNGDYGEYFIELIYRALKKNYTVTEFPYSLVPRERGESKTATTFIGMFKRGIKYLTTVFKLRLGIYGN